MYIIVIYRQPCALHISWYTVHHPSGGGSSLCLVRGNTIVFRGCNRPFDFIFNCFLSLSSHHGCCQHQYNHCSWWWYFEYSQYRQLSLSKCHWPLYHYQLHQGWYYAIRSVFLSFCLSVCVQDYCKSNQRISLKLGLMIGPTNQKNWLTIRGDQVPDMDSGSLFHSPHRRRIDDFRRFIAISHTVAGQFSQLWWNDWRRQGNESTTFWQRSGRHPDQKINLENLDSNARSLLAEVWTL